MVNREEKTAGEKEPKQPPPKILTKPLPIILDEMEANIRAAAEAARRAEEAARIATRAASEAEERAEEARMAGETAAKEATAAAADTATSVKWLGRQAVAASRTALTGLPGWISPTGQMRIAPPLVSPVSPVL